jgi:hypothetical protein
MDSQRKGKHLSSKAKIESLIFGYIDILNLLKGIKISLTEC